MSTVTPQVSVVVTTYNRRAYLVEALTSVLAQTFTDYEVIVGNDGGPDHIGPVKGRFDDERIVWVDHVVRKGLLGNTLDGFGRARGRYLAILQDDDRWAPELLATLVPRLQADPTLTLAFCDHFIIDASGRVDAAHTKAGTAFWGRDRLAAGVHRPFRQMAVVDGTVPIQAAAVFRRDALDVAAFPAGSGTKFDRWVARDIARGNAGAWYEPARLAYCRSHPGQQMVTGKLENARAGIYIYERFLEDPELVDVPRGPLRALAAGDHCEAGVSLIRQGQPQLGRRHLVKSLRLCSRPRAGLALVASFMPRVIVGRL